MTVDGSFDLEVLAKCAGLSTEEFLSMNPHLRQGATPAGAVDVHVPVAKGEGFLVAAAAIPDSERIRVLTHRVKSGETLGQIARRYGTTVSTLQAVNHIKNVNTLRVGTTLDDPEVGDRRSASSRRSSRSRSRGRRGTACLARAVAPEAEARRRPTWSRRARR